MTYPVYIYGSPVLRKPAEKIEAGRAELEKLIGDMFETLHSSDGVGLAAPQIGQSIRMFVVDLTRYADDDPLLKDFKKTVINPEIYDRSDEETLMSEGCLSVPGLYEEVWRPDSIRIRYVDENFMEHDEELKGYPARVFQHEYDHLEGKLFIDRLSPLKRTLLKNRLSATKKGKFSSSYKTKTLK